MSSSIAARRKTQRSFVAFLFVVPALVFYLVFSTIPVIRTIWLSLNQWDGASATMTFVGLANFVAVFSEPIFWKALMHNLFWIAFTIVFPVGVGLILAVMLNQKFIRFRLLFRVTFYLPAVVSLVAVSIVWTWIYNPVFGILNRAFSALGLSGLALNWLGSDKLVLGSLVTAGSWTYYGFCMVIFLAALAGIDAAYSEVALIEGASPVQTFFYVTVPLLRNTVTLVVLNSLIGSFKVFEIIYIMTKGGPFHSSEVISTYMFKTAFNFSEVGKGAAIALVLAVIVAIASITYMNRAERE